jgi:hypothetical protein
LKEVYSSSLSRPQANPCKKVANSPFETGQRVLATFLQETK